MQYEFVDASKKGHFQVSGDTHWVILRNYASDGNDIHHRQEKANIV